MIQTIQSTLLADFDLELSVLRLDLMNLPIGGNKFYKLKYNLLEANNLGKHTLLTFGGAFSNHLRAVALAGKLFGFKTIGMVRGEETFPSNGSLVFAKDCGMDLHYINRADYKDKTSETFEEKLQKQFGDFYMIAEGGSNILAVKGCAEITSQIPEECDFICVPCGTGGTLAGLSTTKRPSQQILGFPVLKGKDFLESEIDVLLQAYLGGISEYTKNYRLMTDYHFGGYAKKKPALEQFISDFEATHKIPLEFVYSGKMFYGIEDLAKKQFFPKGSKIMALHTGGIFEG